MGLLIAINIVMERFLSFKKGPLNFSCAFISICIASMSLGPVGGAVTAALADIIRSLLFPQGPFFPLFTVSQFLYGLSYGWILYNKRLHPLKISIFVAIQYFLLHILLGSVWYYLYANIVLNNAKALIPLILSRLSAAAVNLPVHILGVNLTAKYLYPPISKYTKNLLDN